MELLLRQLPPRSEPQIPRVHPARKPKSRSRTTARSGSWSAPPRISARRSSRRPELSSQRTKPVQLSDRRRLPALRRRRCGDGPAPPARVPAVLHLRYRLAPTHPEKGKQDLQRARSLRSARSNGACSRAKAASAAISSENPGDAPSFVVTTISLGGSYPDYVSEELAPHALARRSQPSVLFSNAKEKASSSRHPSPAAIRNGPKPPQRAASHSSTAPSGATTS